MAKRVKLNASQKRVLRNAVTCQPLDGGLPEKVDKARLEATLRSLVDLKLLDLAGFATAAGRALVGKPERADA